MENQSDPNNENEPGKESNFGQSFREKADDLNQKVSEGFSKGFSQNSDSQLGALAYIPFVGWLIPFFARKDSAFCDFHLRQSLNLNVGLVLIYLLCWILIEGPIIGYVLQKIGFQNITNFVVYVSVWAYLLGSSMAAFKAWKGEMWDVPFLKNVKPRF